MVDELICYTCPKERAEEWLEGVKRDIYTNPQLSSLTQGEPFYREYDKKNVLFLCGVIIPTPIPLVNKLLLNSMWENLKKSGKKASKGKIILKRVKTTEELKEEYDVFQEHREE